MYDMDYSPSGVEQHQHLLVSGRFATPPTSAAHLADRMEAGGAKIEETLARLNCKYQTLFFTAGWGIIVAAVISTVNSIMALSVASLVDSSFLLIFGFIMMILDIPGAPRWAGRYRQLVRKYVKFLTRLTGKSLWFLYLGCMVAMALWPTGQSRRPGVLVFVALCISMFVVFVAVVGLFISFRKSLRLEKVRKTLQVSAKGNSPEVFRKYAITDPTHGMQFEEFNRMSSDYTQGRMQFDVADLAIIYNALDEHQKSAINEREFTEWMAGSMTYI